MTNIVKFPPKSKPDDDDREVLRDALAIAKALGIKLPRKNIVRLSGNGAAGKVTT